jgi:hypothetical protein
MTPFRRYQFEDHNGHLVEVITRTITQQDIAAGRRHDASLGEPDLERLGSAPPPAHGVPWIWVLSMLYRCAVLPPMLSLRLMPLQASPEEAAGTSLMPAS